MYYVVIMNNYWKYKDENKLPVILHFINGYLYIGIVSSIFPSRYTFITLFWGDTPFFHIKHYTVNILHVIEYNANIILIFYRSFTIMFYNLFAKNLLQLFLTFFL